MRKIAIIVGFIMAATSLIAVGAYGYKLYLDNTEESSKVIETISPDNISVVEIVNESDSNLVELDESSDDINDEEWVDYQFDIYSNSGGIVYHHIQITAPKGGEVVEGAKTSLASSTDFIYGDFVLSFSSSPHSVFLQEVIAYTTIYNIDIDQLYRIQFDSSLSDEYYYSSKLDLLDENCITYPDDDPISAPCSSKLPTVRNDIGNVTVGYKGNDVELSDSIMESFMFYMESTVE